MVDRHVRIISAATALRSRERRSWILEAYLVRIWSSAEPDEVSSEVRGLVERVRDGEKVPFVGVGQLLELLKVKDIPMSPPA